MTPANIVNMALLNGLELIALTDHNSSRNCPAFLELAERAGITALPGMELCTAEEVHAVCLFRSLSDAMDFDAYVSREKLPNIKNRPDIFGDQLIMDAEDNVVGSVDTLLINAADISFFELDGLMREFGGFYFPAHIEKDAFSLLANLGFVPPDCAFTAFEMHDQGRYDDITLANPILAGLPVLVNSDAHYLWDIATAEHETSLPFFREKER